MYTVAPARIIIILIDTCVATYIVLISSKPCSESFMYGTAMQLFELCNGN